VERRRHRHRWVAGVGMETSYQSAWAYWWERLHGLVVAMGNLVWEGDGGGGGGVEQVSDGGESGVGIDHEGLRGRFWYWQQTRMASCPFRGEGAEEDLMTVKPH